MKHRQGFTLVELSIVLVIIGLLTGGVLSGQALIRAAELKAVTTEYNKYNAAVNAFRDKYQAIPGDMNNASKFWGLLADCTVESTSTATCDGDGNGQVGDSSPEMFRFWQHLANAGLIEGSYTGVKSATLGDSHVLGKNAPRSKLNNAGWGFSYLPPGFTGDAATFALNYGNLFWFGAVLAERPQHDILKPEEAWNIDSKIDDGKPATGKAIVRSEDTYGTAANCSTAANNTDFAASYNLTNQNLACAFMFRNQ